MSNDPTPTQAVEPGNGGMSWKTRAYLIGAALGLLLGLASAYLYIRAAGENASKSEPGRIRTGDAMKLTLAILGLVRQIADLGGK